MGNNNGQSFAPFRRLQVLALWPPAIIYPWPQYVVNIDVK